MGSVTLLQLRTRARTRANMPVAGFVSDVELNQWVNEGVQLLHEKLVTTYGQEYVESTSALTTVSTQSDYTLPADFFKLYGVDLLVTSRTRSLRPFNLAERNIFKDARFSNVSPPRYLVVGNVLRLAPLPPSSTGTIYYAPEAATLALDADTYTSWNGWEKYVVAYAAQQMLMKEESDHRDLDALIAKWDKMFEEDMQSRDAAFPKQVTDVEAIAAWDETGWP